MVKRVRYICYGKTRHQTNCDGQTGYTVHIVDGLVEQVVLSIFEKMKAVPKSEIINARYQEKVAEQKLLLKQAKADLAKAGQELELYKAEVLNVIRGESSFSRELLSGLIQEAEVKYTELQNRVDSLQANCDSSDEVLANLNARYDEIISWSELYQTASMEAKKMIVNCLIRRIEVSRDYKLHLDFNIDFEQFNLGLDVSAENQGICPGFSAQNGYVAVRTTC